MLTSRPLALGTNTVKNRFAAIDRKAMLRGKMTDKVCRRMTVQVLNLATPNTFFMEVIAAIASVSDVLINKCSACILSVFAHDTVCDQFRELTVNAALADRGRPRDSSIKLLCRKVTVGMLLQKRRQRAPSGSLIVISFHGFPLFLEFENSSQIIA